MTVSSRYSVKAGEIKLLLCYLSILQQDRTGYWGTKTGCVTNGTPSRGRRLFDEAVMSFIWREHVQTNSWNSEGVQRLDWSQVTVWKLVYRKEDSGVWLYIHWGSVVWLQFFDPRWRGLDNKTDNKARPHVNRGIGKLEIIAVKFGRGHLV